MLFSERCGLVGQFVGGVRERRGGRREGAPTVAGTFEEGEPLAASAGLARRSRRANCVWCRPGG